MLAVIYRPNPFFPPGTWVEGTDDGWQKVITEVKDNRLHIVKTVGFVYPRASVDEFVIRPKKRGLDK